MCGLQLLICGATEPRGPCRKVITAVILLQIMYMSLVLYTPCLALSVGKSAQLQKFVNQNLGYTDHFSSDIFFRYM